MTFSSYYGDQQGNAYFCLPFILDDMRKENNTKLLK